MSYYFPPYDKVGGRRWAKHVKYLNRLNIGIKVICGKFSGYSGWNKDTVEYTNKVIQLDLKKPFVPYHLSKLPSSLLDKIKWKLSLWSWERKKNTLIGNYRDVSKPMREDFLKATYFALDSIHPEIVILSVGPYAYSEILLSIKSRYPQIKLVIDYRDYWEDELQGLTIEQINYEKQLQTKVLSSVDLVLCPNEEMKGYFEKLTTNVYCLPHCIDTDDFLNLPVKSTASDNAIRLIYGGAFYSGLSEILLSIRRFVQLIAETSNVQADFFVSVKGYETELAHPLIKRSGFIDTPDYFASVIAADFVLIILPENRKNAQSSKFYELVALKKPILYFGPEGVVSEYILKHGLGLHVHKANMHEMVERVIAEKNHPTMPQPINIEDKTFKYQTGQLLNRLSEL